ETLVAQFPDMPQYRQELAYSHNNQAFLLDSLERPSEALAAYDKALALQQQLAGQFPDVPEYHQELAGNYHNRGILFRGLGQREKALAECDKAIALQEKLT